MTLLTLFIPCLYLYLYFIITFNRSSRKTTETFFTFILKFIKKEKNLNEQKEINNREPTSQIEFANQFLIEVKMHIAKCLFNHFYVILVVVPSFKQQFVINIYCYPVLKAFFLVINFYKNHIHKSLRFLFIFALLYFI